MTRALNKQSLFDDEKDYLYLLQIISDVKKETHFKLYAYCLMTNHFHILIKEKDVKATFFVVGRLSDTTTPLYKRIVDEGHTIGMHSYTHVYKEIYAQR